MPRFVVVKKQVVKDDKKYYGIYLLDRMLRKYVRILTFKDDKRGYAVLDTVAYYIGDDKIEDYFDKLAKGENVNA